MKQIIDKPIRNRDKELSGLVVGKIDLGKVVIDNIDRIAVEASIIQINDGISQLYIPAFVDSSWANTSEPIPKGRQLELNEEQQSRLKRALEINLPPFLTVHLALNKNEELDEYRQLATSPTMIGVYGRPGELKSKAMTILEEVMGRSHEIKVEAINFDSYSPRGLDTYRQVLAKAKNTKRDVLTMEEMLRVLEKVEGGETADRLSLRTTLDKMLEKFKQGNQTSIFLVDFPGLGDRGIDAYDVLAKYGMVTVVANKGETEMTTIGGYLRSLHELGGMDFLNLITTDYNRGQVFKKLVGDLTTAENKID